MRFVNIYINKLADMLLKDGIEIIKKAEFTKQAQNRFFNLADAYGCAVYYKGKAIKKGYANNMPLSQKPHEGWKKHHIESNTGRGYLEEFFDNYTPPTQGMFLICVNAIFYATILEDGNQNKGFNKTRKMSATKAKYRIISQVDGDFDKLRNKYGGTVRDLRK